MVSLILSCDSRALSGPGGAFLRRWPACSWWSSPSTVWTVDHAVVVGAGIGGLAASLVLSRVAARVTLVERAERPSEVGAALALQPNGMAVLDSLGLLSAVEAVGARIDRMDIRSVTGRRLLTARGRAEGKTDPEIRRCLKRYIAQELYRRAASSPRSSLDIHRSVRRLTRSGRSPGCRQGPVRPVWRARRGCW